jgi:membrane-anchored protein YejM (alkaline phosphatase superfamily)
MKIQHELVKIQHECMKIQHELVKIQHELVKIQSPSTSLFGHLCLTLCSLLAHFFLAFASRLLHFCSLSLAQQSYEAALGCAGTRADIAAQFLQDTAVFKAWAHE